MKIVIAGASGFLGGALVPVLRADGHEIVRLVRRAATKPDEAVWHPEKVDIDTARIQDADAFINLAGENIGAGRWTAARREAILRSRVDATRTLVAVIKALPRPPAVLLNASATGFYGDRGDEILTERSAIGHGFLPEVCLAWETHAEGAARVGVRTVLLRFGVILAPQGGALARMLPIFKLGLGGRLGPGKQWMSWIALADTITAIRHCLRTTLCSGPINIVAPQPVMNAEFTKTVGDALGRPAVLPVPAWALRLALGEMADAGLLASVRAVPEQLQRTGFHFQHADLASALHATLGKG